MFPKNLWFNYWSGDFDQEEDSFFDTSSYKWHKEIENDADSIIKDCISLVKLKNGKFQPYFLKEMDGYNSNWCTITLKTWGVEVKNNLNDCPAINNWLNENPQVISFAISKLNPQSEIKEHRGDTNAIWRCHMGIKVPGNLSECGFEVNGIQKEWKVKKVFSFSDAHLHKAWNKTDDERWIIIFDVLKPEYFPYRSAICVRVRAFMVFQGLMQKFGFIKKSPKMVHWIIYLKLQWIIGLLLPFQKKNGVILKHE